MAKANSERGRETADEIDRCSAVELLVGSSMKPSIFNYALAHAAGFSAAIGIVWALGVLFGNLQFPEALATDSGVALWTVIAAIPTAATPQHAADPDNAAAVRCSDWFGV